MLFNSIDFLIFFPLVVLVYFLIPKKVRYIWLLIASYYFYMCWNPKYALLMLTSTLITYVCARIIDRDRVNKRVVSILCLTGNLGILALFKYANFFLDNLNRVLKLLDIEIIDKRLDLLLPVGISFYTFQALSYFIDVYRGTIKAEKSFLKYALFVSFFPQLVAGPIERSKNLLGQLQNIENVNVWDFDRVREGVLIIFWGLFQKLVIADRAALLVNQVYNNYSYYGMIEITIATVLFAFQIYCDFGGYSNIARGSARVLGINLMQNFKQPYLAISIKDFWRRWHISLTSWFTDYLYIPLGGNRKSILRKYLNIFIVFAVSGLWHGASWNFIVWGVLHGIFRIVGEIKQRYLEKIGKERKISFSANIRKVLGTFILVDIAWVFFASNSFTEAVEIIRQAFTTLYTTSVLELGLDKGNWIILIVAIFILYIVDILHEKKISVFSLINKQEIWFRWILYMGLIYSTILVGIYGIQYDASQFIYFQF